MMTHMMIFKESAPTTSVKIAEDVFLIWIGFVVCSITARCVRHVWRSLPVMPVLTITPMVHTASRARPLMITT